MALVRTLMAERLQLIGSDPPPDQVRRMTFVPFLPDGRCALIDDPAGPALPSGLVEPGEDYLIDTVLRIPLETAGFRYQRFRPFGLAGTHLYGWIEGAPYAGWRPHRRVSLAVMTPDAAADWLRQRGHADLAGVVLAAGSSYRDAGEQTYYSDSLRTLQRAYLRGRTPQEGSGFGGDEVAWRQAREHLTEGIGADGMFLLLDCVPAGRRAGLVRHHLASTVRVPGGRLLVSDYGASPAQGLPAAAETLRALGFACAGQSSGGCLPGRPPAPTAWIDA